MILFETLNQPKILLNIILGGFVCGLIFDICYLVTFLCNNNKITKNILEFFSIFFCFFILFVINQKLNYGQMRIYVFVFFVTSLLIERLTLGKIIAKTRNWCYTQFRKFANKLTKVIKWNKRKNSK